MTEQDIYHEPPKPEDVLSPEELAAFESEVAAREMRDIVLSDPGRWEFDINDPDLFKADPDVQPFDASQLQAIATDQAEATQHIVDEETLNKAVAEWFDNDVRFATPIVEGTLFRGSIGAIYGPSHGGKTLATMAMCDCISRGVPFGDLGVRKGPVVYLNSEARGDFNKRYTALSEAAGIDGNDNFRAMHCAFDVRDVFERAKLMGILPRLFGEGHLPPVFVFDTLAQHLSGVPGEAIDENSAKDMGQYIYGLRDLAERTNGVVLLVAHSGKDGEKGIRGSSALRAALDTEIRVTGIKDRGRKLIRMDYTKQRFCDSIDPACYAIESINLKTLNHDVEEQLTEDDVMIKPQLEVEQFQRKVAPSNQSAVMSVVAMAVPGGDDDEQEESPREGGKKLTEDQRTNADILRGILLNDFEGVAHQGELYEAWIHQGNKKGSFSAAVIAATKKKMIVRDDFNRIQSTVAKSNVGRMRSARDIQADKDLQNEEF